MSLYFGNRCKKNPSKVKISWTYVKNFPVDRTEYCKKKKKKQKTILFKWEMLAKIPNTWSLNIVKQ